MSLVCIVSTNASGQFIRTLLYKYTSYLDNNNNNNNTIDSFPFSLFGWLDERGHTHLEHKEELMREHLKQI